MAHSRKKYGKDKSKEGIKMSATIIARESSRDSHLTLVEPVCHNHKRNMEKFITCEETNKYDKAFNELTEEEMEILVDLMESK